MKTTGTAASGAPVTFFDLAELILTAATHDRTTSIYAQRITGRLGIDPASADTDAIAAALQESLNPGRRTA